MCGIVGYVGGQLAAPILLDGLRKLEYRGYDSAGVALHEPKGLTLVRSVGKLINLSRALEAGVSDAHVGIGHTRWATHGRPSEANAHPHRSGKVALVHNGIIENHGELKRRLLEEGVVFSSDTDTEIVAHLVQRALLEGASCLFDAVRSALKVVRGAYAIAVVSEAEPDRIVIAKSSSPLVIGLGKGEVLCGSDIPALLGVTRTVMFLEDGDVAELSLGGVRVETLAGQTVTRPTRHIDWSPMQAEKGGHKHFMLKEIFEQPRAVEDTLRGRIDLETASVTEGEIGLPAARIAAIRRVVLIACGTSYHACLAGRYWIEELARLPAQAELASEVRYRDPIFTPEDLVIAVSQSGETADTLAALQAAKQGGAFVLGVANVIDSAIPRISDGVLYTHAGPEIGVASTKCYTAQLVGLLLLAIYLGRQRNVLDKIKGRESLKALLRVPELIRGALEHKDEVLKVARQFQRADHMLFLGRGTGYPTALEGALKLKEVSYAHAEGYAAGEMKHGPIALIDANMPVVVVMPSDRQYEKTLSNLQEVRAREAQVIAVVGESNTEVAELAHSLLRVPDAPELVSPLVCVIPLQLLAYYIADLKGTDVDQPRNLAKTVTVE